MKKRFVKSIAALMLTLCMVGTNLPMVMATDESSNDVESLSPKFTGVFDGYVSIDIKSSGRAGCYGYVTLKKGYTGTFEMYLQRHVSDDIWTNIKGWSVSGSGELELDKIYYVTSGHTYRTTTIVDVYDSNGDYVETVIAHSGSQAF